MKTSTFLFGLTTGAIGGMVAVLLSTPQSGKEFRASLQTTKEDLQNRIADIKGAIENIKNEAQQTIPKVIEESKESFATWQTEAAPIQENLQQEIDSLQSSVEEIEKHLADFQNRKIKKDNA